PYTTLFRSSETTELCHHEPSGKIRLGLRACFLGDTGVGARGHGGPIGSPAQTRLRSWLSLDSSPRYLGCVKSFAEVVYLEPAEKLAHKSVIERLVAAVRS